MGDSLPPYNLTRSARSRHIRVSVFAGGYVRVTAPKRAENVLIEHFLKSKLSWLKEKVEHFKKIPEPKWTLAEDRKLYRKDKNRALEFAEAKVAELNAFYGFSFGRVSIRNSKTRWGSCSSKGTLSFNYKIIYLPKQVADYLVVHELCHLKEHNHGAAFWLLVAKTIPDYVLRRKELRDFDKTFKFPRFLI